MFLLATKWLSGDTSDRSVIIHERSRTICIYEVCGSSLLEGSLRNSA